MTSEIRPLLTDEDLDAALKEINRLWGAQRGTPDGDRLEALANIVEAYEKKHFPIADPTP